MLLPVHNRRQLTEEFVRRLSGQTDRWFHLILIDDGSTDGTADAVTSALPTTSVLRGTGSWWWAGSLQEGYRWLSRRELSPHDIVLIANDDTWFGPDFLANARAALGNSRRVLFRLSCIRRSQASSRSWASTSTGEDSRSVVPGKSARSTASRLAGSFLSAQEFVALRGFHRHLLPHYLSDYEFTIRALRNGFHVRTDASLTLPRFSSERYPYRGHGFNSRVRPNVSVSPVRGKSRVLDLLPIVELPA